MRCVELWDRAPALEGLAPPRRCPAAEARPRRQPTLTARPSKAGAFSHSASPRPGCWRLPPIRRYAHVGVRTPQVEKQKHPLLLSARGITSTDKRIKPRVANSVLGTQHSVL